MDAAFSDAVKGWSASIRGRARRGLLCAAVCVSMLFLAAGQGTAATAQTPATVSKPATTFVVLRRPVPQVSGLELSQAIGRLKEAGFASQAISDDHSVDGQRQVTRTDPAADARAPVNSTVKVYHRRKPGDPAPAKPKDLPATSIAPKPKSDGPVATKPPSQYPPQPRMPSLVGVSCAEAGQRLASLGRALASCNVGAETGSGAAGRINRQDPVPGALLTAMTTVRVWTEPPPTTRVPAVRGLTIKDAVQRIEAARLRAVFPAQALDAWHSVEAQSPAAETRVPVNTAVTLKLVARYVVPDLTELTCAAARSRVTASGLGSVSCQTELKAAGAFAAERIHRQEPAPKTVLSVPRDVTVWVQPALVIVPNVVGLLEDAANAQLTQRQLRPQPSGPAAKLGRRVATQAPPAGTQVPPASPVRIGLQLTVPALKGLDCAAARAQAREHGLADTSCVLRRATPADPINRVFEQKPAAGTLLATAQQLVAGIAEPVVVPDVVGRPLPAALATLQQSGLDGHADATDGDREVRSQQPQRGAQVAPGSTVALATTRFALVPAVAGLTLSEAIGRIRGSGFMAADDVAAGVRKDDRRVRSQAPAAGSRSRVGSRVELATYLEVVVPDVVRIRLPDASARLQQAGLAAKPDREDDAAQRDVRAQTPAAGDRVPEGSAVQLTTVRLVVVPDLTTLSYSEASASASAAGVRLERCAVDLGRVPSVLAGTITVTSQTPAAKVIADEGAVVTCVGKPSWMPLIVTVATTSTLSLLAGGLLVLRHRRWAKAKAAVATARWRPMPDPRPLVDLRLASDDEAGPPGSSGAMAGERADSPDSSPVVPTIAWRRIWSDPLITVRGAEALEVERDDQPA